MKKRILRFIATIAIMLLGINSVAYAVQIEFHTFENPQRERLYLDLIAELRCVKCQNQNLAESDAELAKDMRDKTYEMITKGKSRDDVVNYMTARYGDFVLYKPPFKTKTFLLWVKGGIDKEGYQSSKDELELALFNDLKDTDAIPADSINKSGSSSVSTWLILLLIPLIAVPAYLQLGNLKFTTHFDPKMVAQEAAISTMPLKADGTPDVEKYLLSLQILQLYGYLEWRQVKKANTQKRLSIGIMYFHLSKISQRRLRQSKV